MKLSIITINYNNVEGLRKTIASVASQTYREIEHIIVDGGSTDGSVDVIKEYESTIKQRVTIGKSTIQVKWLSEKDNGIYNAMNKGVEITLGRRSISENHTSSIIGVPTETNECVSHGESGGTCHLSIKQSGIDYCDLVAERDNRSELVEDKNNGIEIALGRSVVNADHTSSPNSLNAKHSTLNETLCDYIWILNSGDSVAQKDVIAQMMEILAKDSYPLLLGNIVHVYGDGRKVRERKKTNASDLIPRPIEASMLTFYNGTIPHDATFVRRDLFEKFGYFDETMKICADWKLYLDMIALGGVVPMYMDIDVVYFDMSGVSNTNNECRLAERRAYLEQVLPVAVLKDYDEYAASIAQYNRIRKHHLWGLVRFVERVLFKFERWGILHK